MPKIPFTCPAEGCEYSIDRACAARVVGVCPDHGTGSFEPDEDDYEMAREVMRTNSLGDRG